MLTVDYFVYDNRTWTSGIGRDWGTKAATGALAGSDELRRVFERYCARHSGDRGYLDGFGEALGGVRPPNGYGYLLCATVETPDTIGRPSWAVYGLWCPDVQTLESALASDVIGAAQSAVRATSQPPSIALTPALPLPVPLRIAAATPVFRRFEAKTALDETRALLLGAIRQQRPLPAILGITGSSRLAAAGQEFDVVYSHPLDDRAELVFQQLQGGDDAPFELLRRTAPAAPAPAVPPVRKRRHPGVSRWTFGLGIAVAAVLLFGQIPALQREPAARDIAAQVAAIRALDPRELRGLADRGNDRAVRKACVELIEQWQRIAVSSTAGTHAWTRDSRPLAGQPCRVLQLAYPADFDDPRSTARRWCDSLARLERTARTLRSASGKTRS
jgi:hypothetical protein